MSKHPKVSIIILNWNGAEDTIRCIDSFSQMQYPNYGLIIVDNGSTDNSVKRIKERFPTITLIEIGENLGYTGGNNVGTKYAVKNKADYVLIVNNDTELISTQFLKEMAKKMEEDPSVGIMGPKVLNPGSQIQDTILFTPTLFNCVKKSLNLQFGSKRLKDYNIPQIVESVSGVCWLIKREVIENVGLLDEDYFMYAEEQDYCYRAQRAGWKVMYYPVESVIHYKELVIKNKERNYRQYIYARRNLVLFLRKHFGFWQALILTALFLTSNILKVTFSRLTEKEKHFYNMSLLSALFFELKYVLSGKWRKASKLDL